MKRTRETEEDSDDEGPAKKAKVDSKKERKDRKDGKDSKDAKETKDGKDSKETKDGKEPKDSKDSKESKVKKSTKESKVQVDGAAKSSSSGSSPSTTSVKSAGSGGLAQPRDDSDGPSNTNLMRQSLVLSAEDLQCAICHNLVVEPAHVPCGHVLCLACVREWCDVVKPEAKTDETKYTCPTCRQFIGCKPQALTVNSFLNKRLLPRAKLGCCFGACDAEFERGSLTEKNSWPSHYKTCASAREICPLCTEFVAFQSMDDHLKNQCNKREIQCRLCRQHHGVSEHEKHRAEGKETGCPRFVLCPRACLDDQKGRAAVRSDFVGRHMDTACPHRTVTCPIGDCGATAPLHEISVHYLHPQGPSTVEELFKQVRSEDQKVRQQAEDNIRRLTAHHTYASMNHGRAPMVPLTELTTAELSPVNDADLCTCTVTGDQAIAVQPMFHCMDCKKNICRPCKRKCHAGHTTFKDSDSTHLCLDIKSQCHCDSKTCKSAGATTARRVGTGGSKASSDYSTFAYLATQHRRQRARSHPGNAPLSLFDVGDADNLMDFQDDLALFYAGRIL